jgi:predicted permease
LIERILGIFLPVFSIALVGYVWARRVRPDMTTVNRIGMNVVAPALIFSALSSKSFDITAYGPLMLACVGVVLGSGLLAWPIARMMRVDARTFVPPMMFNNCGNMGLPLAALAFGEAGLSAMVALFSISNLFQFTLGTWIVDHRARFASLARNPMVIATFAGFLFAIAHPPLPDWIATAIRITGDALIPLMLLSLGARLTDMRWDDARLGIVGAVVCPLTGVIMALAIAAPLGLAGTERGLLILFGALPPAVLNFMVAEHHGREPGKVASIVLIGNLLAVLFVPLGLALALAGQ